MVMFCLQIEVGSDDIIAKQPVFTIGTEANENSKLPVEVTIHALKEEAKDQDMESGVSTDESE